MKRSRLNRSRLIIGLILVGIAVLMFLFARGTYANAGAIAVLGLVSIAISRR